MYSVDIRILVKDRASVGSPVTVTVLENQNAVARLASFLTVVKRLCDPYAAAIVDINAGRIGQLLFRERFNGQSFGYDERCTLGDCRLCLLRKELHRRRFHRIHQTGHKQDHRHNRPPCSDPNHLFTHKTITDSALSAVVIVIKACVKRRILRRSTHLLLALHCRNFKVGWLPLQQRTEACRKRR